MEQYRYKGQKKLRCGITSGTCAAVATSAAVRDLLQGIQSEIIKLRTPKGVLVEVPVYCKEKGNGFATYGVIKDSGDDPDVTNGAEILVTVKNHSEEITDKHFTYEVNGSVIYLDGGVGIGRITEAGMEQQIGQAAINMVPRKMIFEAAEEVMAEVSYNGDLEIIVSVPEGESLAKKTFNPKLGIQGGISILGTSGILEPMSEQAIIDTIETQIRQLSLQGEKKLLITPGNYGQSYVSEYLGLDLEKSVKCSNYIGATLDLAVSYEMETVLLVGNIGKLIKLAAGIMNTHSKTADGRCEIMAVHVGLNGGSKKQMEQIMECVNTDQMLAYLKEWELFDEVMESLLTKIQDYVAGRLGENIKFAVFLFSEKYGFLGATKEQEDILAQWKF